MLICSVCLYVNNFKTKLTCRYCICSQLHSMITVHIVVMKFKFFCDNIYKIMFFLIFEILWYRFMDLLFIRLRNNSHLCLQSYRKRHRLVFDRMWLPFSPASVLPSASIIDPSWANVASVTWVRCGFISSSLCTSPSANSSDDN